ncbi:MAG: FAD-dependent oxidoreductase [Bacteroidales bacterium]|nr:FAD-dependent oxidoreductase [Bacteroidales bacterium]
MNHVIIIGAGLAGLSCGRRLFQCGVPFTILEAADAVGGRIRTDVVEGFRLDRGCAVYLTTSPEGRRILDTDALDLRPFARGLKIWRGKRFVRVADPLQQPLRTLGSLFPRMGTISDAFRLLHQAAELGHGDPERLPHAEERPALDLLRWNWQLSDRLIDRVFRPLSEWLFRDRSLAVSSRLLRHQCRMLWEGGMAIPASGMQAIPEQLAAGLPQGTVRLHTPVESLEGNTVRLTNGDTLTARAIVMATDGTTAARLSGHAEPVPRWHGVTRLHYASDTPPTTEPILHLDGTGTGPIHSAVVMSAVAPTYAPPGQSLLSATVSGVPTVDDGELDRRARSQLSHWFGGDVSSWRLLRIDRIPQAILDQTAGTLDPWERPVRLRNGLFICGGHRDQGTLNGAMMSGFRAAQTLMQDTAKPDPQSP